MPRKTRTNEKSVPEPEHTRNHSRGTCDGTRRTLRRAATQIAAAEKVHVRITLLIQPHVLVPVPVEEAVHHDGVALDVRVPARGAMRDRR